jgi:hypothetical protein
MKPNPILDELWKVKDALAAEAGYDVDRFLENLRRWEAEHPHAGRIVGSAEDLRQLVAEEERKRTEAAALVLKDKPPRQG